MNNIKQNAPQGATHYSETIAEIIYLRFHKDTWNCYVFGGWFYYTPEIGQS